MDLAEPVAVLFVVGPWFAGRVDAAVPAVGPVVYRIVDRLEGRMKHVAVVAALLPAASRGRSDRPPVVFGGCNH